MFCKTSCCRTITLQVEHPTSHLALKGAKRDHCCTIQDLLTVHASIIDHVHGLFTTHSGIGPTLSTRAERRLLSLHSNRYTTMDSCAGSETNRRNGLKQQTRGTTINLGSLSSLFTVHCGGGHTERVWAMARNGSHQEEALDAIHQNTPTEPLCALQDMKNCHTHTKTTTQMQSE